MPKRQTRVAVKRGPRRRRAWEREEVEDAGLYEGGGTLPVDKAETVETNDR